MAGGRRGTGVAAAADRARRPPRSCRRRRAASYPAERAAWPRAAAAGCAADAARRRAADGRRPARGGRSRGSACGSAGVGRRQGRVGLRAAALLGIVERGLDELGPARRRRGQDRAGRPRSGGALARRRGSGDRDAGEPVLAKLQRTLWLARITLERGARRERRRRDPVVVPARLDAEVARSAPLPARAAQGARPARPSSACTCTGGSSRTRACSRR